MPSRVSDLQFSKSKHRYTDPRFEERPRYTGVTTVVGSFDPAGSKVRGMVRKAVSLTLQGIDYRREWDGKRDQGTRLHENAEDWWYGRTTEVLKQDEPLLDSLAWWIRERKPELVFAERHVISAHGYGGRFDFICYIEGIGFVLIDLKTGRAYHQELRLQLAAYKFADGIVIYDDKGNAERVEPMPHVDACMGLYLDHAGNFPVEKLFPSEDLPAIDKLDHNAFLSILEARQWAATIKEFK